MKVNLLTNKTKVGTSQVQGFGVFLEEDVSAGDIIETCVVLPIPDVPDKTMLWNHQVAWDDQQDAVLTGNGMLYNYSDIPNCKMVRDLSDNLMHIVALENIHRGCELFVKYKCEPWW